MPYGPDVCIEVRAALHSVSDSIRVTARVLKAAGYRYAKTTGQKLLHSTMVRSNLPRVSFSHILSPHRARIKPTTRVRALLCAVIRLKRARRTDEMYRVCKKGGHVVFIGDYFGCGCRLDSRQPC